MKNGELLRTRAQALRKNATAEEKHLWYDFLRIYPVQFRRQVPLGRYIVDFFCAGAKLAVELDGSQHYEGNGPEYDRERTGYLEEDRGLLVLRFTNLEIRKNFEGVCAAIDRAVQERAPSSVSLRLTASPQGEGAPVRTLGRMRGRIPPTWKRGI